MRSKNKINVTLLATEGLTILLHNFNISSFKMKLTVNVARHTCNSCYSCYSCCCKGPELQVRDLEEAGGRAGDGARHPDRHLPGGGLRHQALPAQVAEGPVGRRPGAAQLPRLAVLRGAAEQLRPEDRHDPGGAAGRGQPGAAGRAPRLAAQAPRRQEQHVQAAQDRGHVLVQAEAAHLGRAHAGSLLLSPPPFFRTKTNTPQANLVCGAEFFLFKWHFCDFDAFDIDIN